MEPIEADIVIVGAGISGLATSLGLHRLGFKSLVLEASDQLRASGFALTIWSNAWRALDALGIGESLRQQHMQLHQFVAISLTSGQSTAGMPLNATGKYGEQEMRCVNRSVLLEALAKELPQGTIRYSSKLVHFEDSGNYKLVHLVDGTIIKTKILVGCDGVNSLVAEWLGLSKPAYADRSALRGFASFEHGFGDKFQQFFGEGIRAGIVPWDENGVYWFLTYTPSGQTAGMEHDPTLMKQFATNKLRNMDEKLKPAIHKTSPDNIFSSPLRYRHPWEFLTRSISKGNVCVAGDAFHPMTPDIGQGGCAALEDGVVLARCIARALNESDMEEEEHKRIEMGLIKYAKERRWRGFQLVATAYVVGWFQVGNGKVTRFLRDRFLSPYLADLLLKSSEFDCGKLIL